AEEFHELADDALLAEHFGDGEDQVGRRTSFTQTAGETEADDFGNEHGDWLSQHGRLSLDAADAPPEHTQAVDHRGVGVGAEYGIRVCQPPTVTLGSEHDTGKELQIDLVNDAGIRRHDL